MNHNIDTEICSNVFENNVGDSVLSGAPAGSRSASALIGAGLMTAALTTPAYAATLVTVDQVQPLLLIGSGVLLVVALALKAVSKRHEHAGRIDPDATLVNMAPESTGTIGDYRISRPWNR